MSHVRVDSGHGRDRHGDRCSGTGRWSGRTGYCRVRGSWHLDSLIGCRPESSGIRTTVWPLQKFGVAVSFWTGTPGGDMIDTKESTPVMTLTQAAAYLRVSKAHLSNVINGKVPGVPPVRSFRMGRHILIKREWVDEWME